MNIIPPNCPNTSEEAGLRLDISKLRFYVWNLPFFLLGYAVASVILQALGPDAGAYLGWAFVIMVSGYVVYVIALNRSLYRVEIAHDTITSLTGPRAQTQQTISAPLSWEWRSCWHTWPFRVLVIQSADAKVYVPGVLFSTADLQQLIHSLELIRSRY